MGVTGRDPCTLGLALSPLEYILPKYRHTYTEIHIKESTAVLFVVEHWTQPKHSIKPGKS